MIKYTHTDLIARDWKTLAGFYMEVFGCVPVPPERDLSGEWVDRFTGLPGAHIRGAHLALPGYPEGEGPTLEVFQYDEEAEGIPAAINRPGFGHIAFAVDDVRACVADMIAHGGGLLGDIIQEKAAGRILTAAYALDPEGNIVEVQRWD